MFDGELLETAGEPARALGSYSPEGHGATADAVKAIGAATAAAITRRSARDERAAVAVLHDRPALAQARLSTCSFPVLVGDARLTGATARSPSCRSMRCAGGRRTPVRARRGDLAGSRARLAEAKSSSRRSLPPCRRGGADAVRATWPLGYVADPRADGAAGSIPRRR